MGGAREAVSGGYVKDDSEAYSTVERARGRVAKAKRLAGDAERGANQGEGGVRSEVGSDKRDAGVIGIGGISSWGSLVEE